jgi:hypothetical protein
VPASSKLNTSDGSDVRKPISDQAVRCRRPRILVAEFGLPGLG